MAIYLVQHGISLPKEEDPGKGLSSAGIDTVRRIASVAGNYRIRIEKIMHSGKKRALQTAEILADVLQPPAGTASRPGLAPLDDVAAVAAELDPQSGIMLVGHLPFMERLVSLLTTGSPDFRPFRFQNGGIVCLDRDADGSKWYVKWALMPDIS